MIRTSIGFFAAVAAILLGGSPAVASRPAPTGYPAKPAARLTLTYLAEAGYAAAVKLTCAPAGGGHPEPALACATLRRTSADPEKIKPAQSLCMMIYAPVTAQITGSWRGVPVNWSHKYGNSCEMKRATGVLFQF